MPHPIVRIRRLPPQSVVLGSILPSDIANLDHWWKADSFSLSDGTAIGGTGNEWVDHIGGSTFYGRQGTAAFRPVFKTAIANGLPGIQFTNLSSLATQQFLDCSNGSSANKITYAGDYTILAVIKPSNNASTYQGGSIAADAYLRGGIVDQSGTNMKADNGTAAVVLTGLSSDANTVLSVAFEGSSGTTTMYRNNVSQGSGSLTGMRTSHIGAGANIDGNSSISTRFDGFIFELLYYGRALTSTERGDLQTRYFNRWGI